MNARFLNFRWTLSFLSAFALLTLGGTAAAQWVNAPSYPSYAPPTYPSYAPPSYPTRGPSAPWGPAKDTGEDPRNGASRFGLGVEAGAFTYVYSRSAWAVPAAGPTASLTFRTSDILTMGVRQDLIFAGVPFAKDGDGDASMGPEEQYTCYRVDGCPVENELTIHAATTFVLTARLGGPVSIEAIAGAGFFVADPFPLSGLPLPELGGALAVDLYKSPTFDMRLNGGVSWSTVFFFPHLALTTQI